MLMVISPAKTLDFDTPPTTEVSTQCDFLDQSAQLIKILRPMTLPQVAALMDLSDALASLNVARYQSWKRPFTAKNAKQAVLAFDGDVYDGLDAKSLTNAQLNQAQKQLRILSGLYGILRPLDLMQPYRLEMGTALANPKGKDLYQFWGDELGNALNAELKSHRSKVLVNLASEEYFKAVKGLQYPVLTPVFQEKKGNVYKVVSFSAKRARGMMVRYVLDRKLDSPEQLKDFDADGYRFDANASNESSVVFRRG
jgi:uncharacterized protein